MKDNEKMSHKRDGKGPLGPNGQMNAHKPPHHHSLLTNGYNNGTQSTLNLIPPPHAPSVIRSNRSSFAGSTLPGHDPHPSHDPGSTLRSFVSTQSNVTKITDAVTNHEIKFTKTEGCTPSTCVCLLVAILLISIGATSGIYFGLRSYSGKMLKERVFKGQFIITRGEPYSHKYEKQTSDEFIKVAKRYREKLDKLYNNSHYAKPYKRSEVIALEKARKLASDDLIVHFNLHLSPRIKPETNAADLYLVLADEIFNVKKGLFRNVTVDQDSIDIQERKQPPFKGYFFSSSSKYPSSAHFNHNPWEPRTRFPGLLEGLTTDPTPPPRKCKKIGLSFCNVLPYNETSYPNILGHWNLSSVEDKFIAYRQIVDAECYPLAREFICRLLQPECHEDEMVWPCRDFCTDFQKSCQQWIPKKMAKMIDCKEFPRFSGDDGEDEKDEDEKEKDKEREKEEEKDEEDHIYPFRERKRKREKRQCRAKPGCANELKIRNRGHHVCDAVIDCSDKSDETLCDYCSSGGGGNKPEQLFYCGNRQCVDRGKRCDSTVDCTNGADEKGCLSLSPSTAIPSTSPSISVNGPNKGHYYLSSGYLMSTFRGNDGKVCGSTFLNMTIPLIRGSPGLEQAGIAVCRELGFRDVLRVEPRSDVEKGGSFTQVNDILGFNTIKFQEAPCIGKQVLYVTCGSLDCGRNPAFTSLEKRIEAVPKGREMEDDENGFRGGSLYKAMDGDWPWYGSLTKESLYSCDGTLIDEEWMITASSCFEDTSDPLSGKKGQWRASVGSVRMISRSPLYWEEKEMTALVHSPSPRKGALTLVRLEAPVNVSNYVRPVCLHQSDEINEMNRLLVADCFTVTWDLKGDRLDFVRAQVVDFRECFSDTSLETREKNDLNKEFNWCVKLIYNLNENSLKGYSGGGCPGCGSPGRPLYCNLSPSEPKWHLVGIEAPALGSTLRERRFSFGSSRSNPTHWFSKVSIQTNWIQKIMQSFKQTSGSFPSAFNSWSTTSSSSSYASSPSSS